jgi:hypothetical protein
VQVGDRNGMKILRRELRDHSGKVGELLPIDGKRPVVLLKLEV